MVKELSGQKVSRAMELYLQGVSQTAIANKLKISQSTVSLHITKFGSAVAQQGLAAAGKEYGVMNTLASLHNLASDLKDTKMSVEEAQGALRFRKALQAAGIPEDDYNDALATLAKLKSDGVLQAAVELTKL